MEAPQAHKAYHDKLDDLVGRKFYGEITIYFQNGNPEKIRLTEYITDTQMREWAEKKNKKVLVANK